MSEQCRELWQMLGRGMSYREMSREVGLAAGTLRARVMRCRRQAIEIRRTILEDAHNKSSSRSTK